MKLYAFLLVERNSFDKRVAFSRIMYTVAADVGDAIERLTTGTHLDTFAHVTDLYVCEVTSGITISHNLTEAAAKNEELQLALEDESSISTDLADASEMWVKVQ